MAAPEFPANMNSSLRKVLGESHVASAAVVLLVFWGVGNWLTGMEQCLRRLGTWGIWVVAIRGFPLVPNGEAALIRLHFMVSAELLVEGLFEFFFRLAPVAVGLWHGSAARAAMPGQCSDGEATCLRV